MGPMSEKNVSRRHKNEKSVGCWRRGRQSTRTGDWSMVSAVGHSKSSVPVRRAVTSRGIRSSTRRPAGRSAELSVGARTCRPSPRVMNGLVTAHQSRDHKSRDHGVRAPRHPARHIAPGTARAAGVSGRRALRKSSTVNLTTRTPDERTDSGRHRATCGSGLSGLTYGVEHEHD